MAAARFLDPYIPGNERIMSTKRREMKRSEICGERTIKRARFAKGTSAKNGKIKIITAIEIFMFHIIK